MARAAHAEAAKAKSKGEDLGTSTPIEMPSDPDEKAQVEADIAQILGQALGTLDDPKAKEDRALFDAIMNPEGTELGSS